MNKLVAKGLDCILVPIEEPSHTTGGLYVPDTAKRRVTHGVVISKGSQVSDYVQLGDHVLFSGYSGDSIKNPDADRPEGHKITLRESGIFFVIPESHIIAKLENTTVRVVDLETVRRVIKERINELSSKIPFQRKFMEEVCASLIDRLDNLPISEGLEF